MYTPRTQEESPQSQDTEMCTPRTQEESTQSHPRTQAESPHLQDIEICTPRAQEESPQSQDFTTSVTYQEVVHHTLQEPSRNILAPYRRLTRVYTRISHSHYVYTQLLSCIIAVVSLCISITSTSRPPPRRFQPFTPVNSPYVYSQLLTTPASGSLVRGRITSSWVGNNVVALRAPATKNPAGLLPGS